MTLPVAPNAQAVTCTYCDTQTTPDPALLASHADLPTRLDEVHAAGFAAMREALELELLPGLGMTLLLLLLPGTLTFGLTGPFLYIGTTFFPAWEVPFILGAVGLPMVVWMASWVIPLPWISLLHWGNRAEAQATAEMERLHRDSTDAPRPAQCPSCGDKLQVPHATSVICCLGCDSSLLASEGLLVQWVEDAEARSAAWKVAATAEVERLVAARAVSPTVALAKFYGVAMVLSLGSLGLGIGGAAMLRTTLLAVRPDLPQ
ncbi:MAG: hypothetical protein KC912_19990 [Proteobacteria bacterium]|nr:hypothetical protein [Pseudomonadota bacterium]